MIMKRCINGHFYDNSKYQQCPYCNISNANESKTMPINNSDVQNRFSGSGSVGTTVQKVSTMQSTVGNADSGKTIGVFHAKQGIDPVVGWVVCVEGVAKGQDYRIKAERNFIGRESSMDIAISGDQSISREKHAIISYSPKTNSFMLIPGESHGIVYLNNEEVYTPVELKRGDIIELGETKLMFVPVCGEDFQW